MLLVIGFVPDGLPFSVFSLSRPLTSIYDPLCSYFVSNKQSTFSSPPSLPLLRKRRQFPPPLLPTSKLRAFCATRISQDRSSSFPSVARCHVQFPTDGSGRRLEGGLTGDEVETATIFGDRLDLTGEQIDSSRRLGFVRMIDGEKSVAADFTPTLLPHFPHFALRLFEQESRTGRSVLLVSLQLM